MAGQSFTLWLIAMLKGGVRKTTSTMLLAFELAKRGYSVLVIDADSGTQGVTDWATKVYAAGGELPFDVVQWTGGMGLIVPFIQKQQRQSEATIVLVDIGGEQPDVLRQVVMIADRVISPGGTELGELSRLPATSAIVGGTGVPHHVLLTRVASIGRGAARDCRVDLTTQGFKVLTTEIEHNRDRYAHIWGTTVVVTGSYSHLADELLTSVPA